MKKLTLKKVLMMRAIHLGKVTVLTAVVVTATVAVIATMVTPTPVKAENQFCPPGFHEWVEYDENNDWAVFACDRIKEAAWPIIF